MNSAEKLAAMRDGTKIKGLFPYLETELASLSTQVDGRAAELYGRGELTPELAMTLWAERLAYRRLLRHFEQRVRFGESMGAEIAPQMELPGQ